MARRVQTKRDKQATIIVVGIVCFTFAFTMFAGAFSTMQREISLINIFFSICMCIVGCAGVKAGYDKIKEWPR